MKVLYCDERYESIEVIKLKDNFPSSFHVGHECQESEAFTATIREARDVFDKAKQHGFEFKILDIGGGYPGQWSSLPFFTMVFVFFSKARIFLD